MKPVVALTDSIMVLEVKRYYGQEIIFIAVTRDEGQRFIIEDIRSETLEMAENWELDNYREALMNGTEESMLHYNYQNDISTQSVSPFDEISKRLMLRDAYCPLLTVGEELYLFDFMNDRLCVFDKCGQLQRQHNIDFHKPVGVVKNNTFSKSWDNNVIIIDPVEQKVYAQFKTYGIVTLKEIDLSSGEVKREIRLIEHSFPQNIQVYDGEVFYLYLDACQVTYRDRRSLYKMRL